MEQHIWWIPWVRSNWLALFSLAVALCSLAASVSVVRIHRRRFRYDTAPVLHIGYASGAVEVENTGPVAAVGIALALLENKKRPSGRLAATEILRPGDKATIRACDYPKEIDEQIDREKRLSFEHTLRRLKGQPSQFAPDTVAQYLLTRDGKQHLLVRYRAAGESRTRVCLYAKFKNAQGFTEFRPFWRPMRTRLFVYLLEKWRAGNAQYRPPFDWAEFNRRRNAGRDSGDSVSEATTGARL